jgi:fatty-acyl-CoA synthase
LYHHPAIRECCVIASPDERRGETVKAIVALREGADATTPESIVEWARTQMAAYKAPRIVELVDALPRGGSGKLMWRELQDREFAQRTLWSAPRDEPNEHRVE